MRKYEYSDELVNLFKEYMKINDRQYSFYEELGIFELTLKVQGTISKIKYIIDVHEKEIIIYGVCPERADKRDPKMMNKIAEFICQANYGLKDGCFEFDFQDGDIYYKSYINCDNLKLSMEVVDSSMRCVGAMIERYSKGFINIIFNNYSAREAIAECERNCEEIYQIIREADINENLEAEEMVDHLALCFGIVEN